jgi:hypothetical protein
MKSGNISQLSLVSAASAEHTFAFEYTKGPSQSEVSSTVVSLDDSDGLSFHGARRKYVDNGLTSSPRLAQFFLQDGDSPWAGEDPVAEPPRCLATTPWAPQAAGLAEPPVVLFLTGPDTVERLEILYQRAFPKEAQTLKQGAFCKARVLRHTPERPLHEQLRALRLEIESSVSGSCAVGLDGPDKINSASAFAIAVEIAGLVCLGVRCVCAVDGRYNGAWVLCFMLRMLGAAVIWETIKETDRAHNVSEARQERVQKRSRNLPSTNFEESEAVGVSDVVYLAARGKSLEGAHLSEPCRSLPVADEVPEVSTADACRAQIVAAAPRDAACMTSGQRPTLRVRPRLSESGDTRVEASHQLVSFGASVQISGEVADVDVAERPKESEFVAAETVNQPSRLNECTQSPQATWPDVMYAGKTRVASLADEGSAEDAFLTDQDLIERERCSHAYRNSFAIARLLRERGRY